MLPQDDLESALEETKAELNVEVQKNTLLRKVVEGISENSQSDSEGEGDDYSDDDVENQENVPPMNTHSRSFNGKEELATQKGAALNQKAGFMSFFNK